MIILWSILIITNQIPELTVDSIEIIYHLIAEFLTAFILIIGGIGLIKKYKWGFRIFLISLGMLLYTAIVSAGYYADGGNIPMVVMFTVIQLSTLLFIFFGIRHHHIYEINN